MNQLGAAVGGGDDLPVVYDSATVRAGPVCSLVREDRMGAVRPGTLES